jgi:hypothetical protein
MVEEALFKALTFTLYTIIWLWLIGAFSWLGV